MTRARWSFVLITSNVVIIRDANDGRSVTNDAEEVVATLSLPLQWASRHVPGLGSRRLFYVDSDNRLDELVHDGAGRFLGFAPIGPRRADGDLGDVGP